MRTPSIPPNWQVLIALTYAGFFLYMVVVQSLVYTPIVVLLLGTIIGYLTWRVWRVFRMHEERLEAESGGAEQTGDESEPENDPVESLKRQYTSGKLSEAEFEEQLEHLLGDDNESEEERTATRETEI